MSGLKNYRLNAFTLLEMLFSLSLLSIAFIVILVILEINFQIIGKSFSGNSSANESFTLNLLSLKLNSILNNSYSIEEISRNTFLIHSFNNDIYQFKIENNSFLIEQISGLNKNQQTFKLEKASSIQTGIKKSSGRIGFYLSFEGKNYKSERWFILGYLKRELQKTNTFGAQL